MLKKILEQYDDEDILIADGFDDAVIGIVTNFVDQLRLVYSVKKCIEILMKDDEMSYEEAYKYFTYKVSGGYIENGPIWCWDDFGW